MGAKIEQAVAHGKDYTGVVWDILTLLKFAIKRQHGSSSRIDFSVMIYEGGTTQRDRKVDMYSTCGPGDSGEPVITIMLPHED